MNILNKIFNTTSGIKDTVVEQPNSNRFIPKEELTLFGVISMKDIEESNSIKELKDIKTTVESWKDGNELKFLETGSYKYKKNANFCNYFLKTIKNKVEDLERIQKVSRGVLNSKKNNRKTLPEERWLEMVNVIVELYPNVDLGKVDRIVKGKLI